MGQVGIMGLRAPGGSWDDTKELAIMADDLGYSCITMGESWGEDAFTSLAQISAVTKRIKIGRSIVPVFARSPANLAMTALNMDVMSKGRFFLGLGASGKLVIEGLHGEKFSKPITRIREYVDILRKAMKGERLDHSGEFFEISRFKLRFTPQRSDLPIYIASLSPPSLRMTGEIADGWLPIFLAPSRMDAAIEQLKEGAESNNRTLDDITISPQASIYVTDEPKVARDRERPHISFYIGGMGVFYHQYMHRIGFGEEADMIRKAYMDKERGKAASLVTDEMVDAMTIIGTPEECASQIKQFFDAGVDEIRLVLNEDTKQGYEDTIQYLAPHIN